MNITQKPNFSSHTKENFVKMLLNLPKHDTKIAVGIGEGRTRSKGKTSEGFLCNLKMALVPQKSKFPVKAHSSISTNSGLLLLFRFFFFEFLFFEKLTSVHRFDVVQGELPFYMGGGQDKLTRNWKYGSDKVPLVIR